MKYNPATYEPPVRPLVYYRPKYTPSYTVKELRAIREMRAEAAKEEKLLPRSFHCINNPCMCCESDRAYWDRQLHPKTLTLF